MTDPTAVASQAQALVRAGALFHARGWVPATAGNFSFRIDDATVAVTASGRHKGELSEADLVRMSPDGRVLEPGRKASDEALLHCALYRRDAGIGAVLHTHSPAATMLSRGRDDVRLAGYELLKICEGITTHEAAVTLPVFENDQDIARLARAVDAAMDTGQAWHGYLIRGHGLYAWGRDVAHARHRIEALEFMLECEWRAATAGPAAREETQ